MRLLLAILISFSFLCNAASAQPGNIDDNVWSLQRCVQYAIEHNISIKQDSLTARLARYTLLQSQLSQLPVLSASGNYGESFGRSINPTTNQFVDANYNFVSATGNGNLLLFGWMQVRNTIARTSICWKPALPISTSLRMISVNVANGFLAALLAKETIDASANQVKLSKAQLGPDQGICRCGQATGVNVAQLESQLATDIASLINSIANYNSAILDLKTLLNLDFGAPFTIHIPDIVPAEELAVSSMLPEDIYKKARLHFGSIKGSELRVTSAEKGLAAAKGNLYPQISLGYQVGTNWANNFYNYQQTNQLLGLEPIGFTGRSLDTVYSPVYKTATSSIPFGTQLNNNFRQTVFLGVNIPIFNSWQGQYAVRQAKINLAQQQLNEYNAELTLKQNVYKAHNNALNSIQKYYAESGLMTHLPGHLILQPSVTTWGLPARLTCW